MLEFTIVTDESGEFDRNERYSRLRIPIRLSVSVPFMEKKSDVVCSVDGDEKRRVEHNAAGIGI